MAIGNTHQQGVALTGVARDLLHDRRIIDTYLGIGNTHADPVAA